MNPTFTPKPCLSCGETMTKIEMFAGQNTSLDYCAGCANPDGTLFPYEKVLKGYAEYFVKTQGVTREAGLKLAQDILLEQPAWKYNAEILKNVKV